MTLDGRTLHDLSHFLREYWYEKTGLAVALILASFLSQALLINAGALWWVNAIVLVLVTSSIILMWWLSQKPPRTPPSRVGVLVSIICEDDDESKKLREDFLRPLQRLMGSGGAGTTLHFMQLPPHLAKHVIDIHDAQEVLSRSGAHYMLYGDVRLRLLNGVQHHVINLDGIVAHKPVEKAVARAFASEFSELMPSSIRIATENDLLSFQFTSEWTDIVARYIIGVAATLSGDVDYAEALYSDVEERLRNKPNTFPIYQKLSNRLPARMAELFEIRASFAYDAWRKDRKPTDLERLETYLEENIKRAQNPSSQVLHLQAIAAFLNRRDVDAALGFMKKLKGEESGLWHYNMAFLYCYKGDLKRAARHYREAASFRVEPEIIAQVEEFLCFVLEQEPECCQLNYCLGLFNWKTKGDRERARRDFKEFVDSPCSARFDIGRGLAQKSIDELSA